MLKQHVKRFLKRGRGQTNSGRSYSADKICYTCKECCTTRGKKIMKNHYRTDNINWDVALNLDCWNLYENYLKSENL